MSEAFRCPTCRGPWRGAAICPRCGSDLIAIMRLAAKAWELREAAREALCAGEHPASALDLARAACRLHATPQGQRLLALALLAAGQMAEALEVIERPPEPLR
jgi:predicted amidophosphoribosyltransferase